MDSMDGQCYKGSAGCCSMDSVGPEVPFTFSRGSLDGTEEWCPSPCC